MPLHESQRTAATTVKENMFNLAALLHQYALVDQHGKPELVSIKRACCGDIVGAKAQMVKGHWEMLDLGGYGLT
jgi:hypothetical protein